MDPELLALSLWGLSHIPECLVFFCVPRLGVPVMMAYVLQITCIHGETSGITKHAAQKQIRHRLPGGDPASKALYSLALSIDLKSLPSAIHIGIELAFHKASPGILSHLPEAQILVTMPTSISMR